MIIMIIKGTYFAPFIQMARRRTWIVDHDNDLVKSNSTDCIRKSKVQLVEKTYYTGCLG